MIDWKRRCLEIAEVVDRHHKDRMHNDMKLGWEMAAELKRLSKIEWNTGDAPIKRKGKFYSMNI